MAAVFLQKLDRRLELLKQQPFMVAPSSAVKNVRAILITRHNRLYYKVTGRKVIVLNMYDTRINPAYLKAAVAAIACFGQALLDQFDIANCDIKCNAAVVNTWKSL